MDELINGFNVIEQFGIPTAIASFFTFIGKKYLDKRLNDEKSSLDSVLNQKLEIQKQKLKNSEFVFHRQYEASQDLYLLRCSLLPEYRTPDMDWEDAVEFVAENLGDTVKKLKDFIAKYFTVLSPKVVELLHSALNAAEEGQFYGDKQAFMAASIMYESVTECSSMLKSEVDGQRQVEIMFSQTLKR